MMICGNKIKMYTIPDFTVIDVTFDILDNYQIDIYQGKCLAIMSYLINEGFVTSYQSKKFLVRDKTGKLIILIYFAK